MLLDVVLTSAEALLPLIEKEAAVVGPVVSNMIAGAMSHDGITDDQLARAQTLRKRADAAYDTAVTARASSEKS